MTELKLSESVLANRVFKPHLYQQLLENSILEVLAPYIGGKLTLDVGGNTGHQAYFQCQHSIKVISYEAVPQVFFQLMRLQETYPHFEARNSAVSDFVGRQTFYVDDKRLSNSGFKDNVGGIPIEVDTVTLDSEGHENVGFIKVDVEGTEFSVLKGAEKIINRDRPNCMVEIYEPFAADPLNVIFDFFLDKKYKCFYYDRQHKDRLVEVLTTSQGVWAVENRHDAHDGDFLFLG